MTALKQAAPAFVEMAHQIVWCVVGTTDTAGKTRTRILHPIWEGIGFRPFSRLGARCEVGTRPM